MIGNIAVNVLHSIKPIEVEGNIYALKKGDSAFTLGYIEKLLKGGKKGIIRIEEDVPLKAVIHVGKNSKAVAFLVPIVDEGIKGLVEAETTPSNFKTEEGEDNSAVEKAIEKEAVKLTKEIEAEDATSTSKEDTEWTAVTGGEPEKLSKEEEGWTIIEEGIVENRQTAEYKQGVKLEQNKTFFKIVIGTAARGYTTKAEAVKRYEWLTEVW